MPSINSSRTDNKLFGEKEFIFAKMTSNQTTGLSGGERIRFNSIVYSSSNQGLSYDPVTYTFSLPANSTFVLQTGVMITGSGSGGYLQCSWYDYDLNLPLVSGNSSWSRVVTGTVNESGQPSCFCVYKTGGSSVRACVTLGTVASLTNIMASGTFAYIEKMEEVVPVKLVSVGNYSFSESATGDLWVDGKPIYKKTINWGALPNTVALGKVHGITTIEWLVKVEAIAHNTSNNYRLVLGTSRDGANDVDLQIDNSDITIETWSDYSAFDECYVTLYYTKV